MNLHFRTLGPAPGTAPALVILHGLFGMADNWQTLARRWADALGRTVYLVDQRNHGRSPHHADISYDLLTDDLRTFFEEQQLGPDTAVLGHSMGGKVAMQFALTRPERLEKLVVVDIAPRAYAPHHKALLDGMRAVDLTALASREAADQALLPVAPDTGTRLFLLKNLYRRDAAEGGGFAWRLNLDALDQHLPALGAEVTHGTPFLKPALFIRGGRSRYIETEDRLVHIPALFPNSQIATVPDVGHWVHAEAPEETYRLVLEFLKL